MPKSARVHALEVARDAARQQVFALVEQADDDVPRRDVAAIGFHPDTDKWVRLIAEAIAIKAIELDRNAAERELQNARLCGRSQNPFARSYVDELKRFIRQSIAQCIALIHVSARERPGSDSLKIAWRALMRTADLAADNTCAEYLQLRRAFTAKQTAAIEEWRKAVARNKHTPAAGPTAAALHQSAARPSGWRPAKEVATMAENLRHPISEGRNAIANDVLKASHKKMVAELDRAIGEFEKNRRGCSNQQKVLDAVIAFVSALRSLDGGYDELLRRATLIVKVCSRWPDYAQAAADSVAGVHFPGPLVEKSIRKLTRSSGVPLFRADIDQNRADIEQVLRNAKLSGPATQVFNSWLAACAEAQDATDNLEVDGCWFLLHLAENRAANPPERAGMAKGLIEGFGGDYLENVRDAADRLLVWASEQPAGIQRSEKRAAGPLLYGNIFQASAMISEHLKEAAGEAATEQNCEAGDMSDSSTLPAERQPATDDESQVPFIPLEAQKAILDALDGRALRTDELASVAKIDRRTLFNRKRKNGTTICGYLSELTDRKLVLKLRRLGYYRPDRPPPELKQGGDTASH